MPAERIARDPAFCKVRLKTYHPTWPSTNKRKRWPIRRAGGANVKGTQHSVRLGDITRPGQAPKKRKKNRKIGGPFAMPAEQMVMGPGHSVRLGDSTRPGQARKEGAVEPNCLMPSDIHR